MSLRCVPMSRCLLALALLGAAPLAGQAALGTRDPAQAQDTAFARLYTLWTGKTKFGSPLVDHLPVVKGIPTPADIIGHHVGAPRTLTYYADQLKYYRALAAATPRVRVETIGRSDEGRELVVVWVSSDANMAKLQQNRDQLAKIADPRGRSDAEIRELIGATKPHYHLMGGLHSGETGPSEMLMELVYRLATETSPVIEQIRNNVYVSVTPAADADGRDRNVDWFYRGQDAARAAAARVAPGTPGAPAAPAGGGRGGGSVPYWGKYAFHDNNRDINLSLVQMRAIADWYFTAHPPIMHDLHESLTLMYTYSGAAPQNPNLDPLLFAELPWFANYEMAQMTKWGMPGVYTYAFMDGWSPGYLGSIAYNHNGLMKMYETQSGRDLDTTATAGAGRGGRGAANAPPAPGGAAPAPGGGRGGAGAPVTPPAGGAVTPPAGGAVTPPATGVVTPPAGGRGAAPTGAPGAATQTPAPAPGAAQAPGGGRGAAGGGGGVPTGRGGAQDREWYRGIPVGFDDVASFSRRANTNYMQTGVLSALQLTAMFPGTVVENFYIKTRNGMEAGKTRAPYAYILPKQRDMTRAAEMVRILRVQRIEVGLATAPIKVGDSTYAAGSYVIKLDQPYGRLAKNLLEKQQFPDARLTTYDDSGWSMGWAFNVAVREIADSTILKAATTPVTTDGLAGRTVGEGKAGIAVAHLGSNNMIAFRYALRDVPMQVTERTFIVDSVEFPAGTFLVTDAKAAARVRAAVEKFGLTAKALNQLPPIATHAADLPRVAIYSQWSGTQELGWYRLTFDNFGIPFDLIYKERVMKGKLKEQYDVILVAQQNLSKTTVMQAKQPTPIPYKKSEKFQFLGMYGETDDMTGGMGQAGVDAFADFLAKGGTLIATGDAMRLPIDFGWAHTVDTEPLTGLTAQRPLVEGEIVKPLHPVFYGYEGTKLPLKYVGGPALRVGVADQGNILGRYVGGDAAVLSGLMTGADALKGRPFAVDIPGANNGKGRVILFANNPIYRWQNHGEFGMVFNAIINWNDVP
ncbi:MAG: hypothetical protein IPO52_01090 [Gemmatimonadetes bacterium]|nr:hypothetical protein [Gemmatimonadota bacterium]